MEDWKQDYINQQVMRLRLDEYIKGPLLFHGLCELFESECTEDIRELKRKEIERWWHPERYATRLHTKAELFFRWLQDKGIVDERFDGEEVVGFVYAQLERERESVS